VEIAECEDGELLNAILEFDWNFNLRRIVIADDKVSHLA